MINKNEQLLSALDSFLKNDTTKLSFIRDINDLIICMQYLSIEGKFNILMEGISKESNFENRMLSVTKTCVLDIELMNTIATDKNTPVSVLDLLKEHTNTGVSQHAKLGLISKNIQNGLNNSEIKKLLSEYQGDEGISLGVRYLIANDCGTNNNTLSDLISDEADFVASAAKNTLDKKMGSEY